jgi:tetratricopeptide (TPR) repeat protein
VTFYIGIAEYYSHRGPLDKALKFSDLAMKLAAEMENGPVQLSALQVRCRIDSRLGNHNDTIKYARMARRLDILRGGSPDECKWVLLEASAHRGRGDLQRALDLCAEAHPMLVASAMENSDGHTFMLDTMADIYFRRSEYIEARSTHERIISMTSSTRSPSGHANSLLSIAEIDIMLSRPKGEVLQNLNSAVEEYATLAMSAAGCEAVAAQLELLHGDAVHAEEVKVGPSVDLEMYRSYRTQPVRVE